MYYQAGVGQVRCRMILRTDPLFTNGQVPSGLGPCLDPQTSTCLRSERYSPVNDLFLVLSLQGVRALTVLSHSNLKMGTLITTLVRPLPNFNTKPCTDMLEQVNQVLPAGAGHDAALTELKDGLRSLFCRGCEKQQVDGVHNAQDIKLLRGAYLKALNGVSPRKREAFHHVDWRPLVPQVLHLPKSKQSCRDRSTARSEQVREGDEGVKGGATSGALVSERRRPYRHN